MAAVLGREGPVIQEGVGRGRGAGAARSPKGSPAVGKLQSSGRQPPTGLAGPSACFSELSVCLSGGPLPPTSPPRPARTFPGLSAPSRWLQPSTRRLRSPRPGSCLSCSPCAPTASATSLASCSTPTPRESCPHPASSSCPFPHWRCPAGDKEQACVPLQNTMSPGCRGHLSSFLLWHPGCPVLGGGQRWPPEHREALVCAPGTVDSVHRHGQVLGQRCPVAGSTAVP